MINVKIKIRETLVVNKKDYEINIMLDQAQPSQINHRARETFMSMLVNLP